MRGSAEDDDEDEDASGTVGAAVAAAAKADAAEVDVEPEVGDELEEKVDVGQSGAKRREGECCCELGDRLLRLREAIETDDVPLPAVVEAGERSSGEGRFLLLNEVDVAAFMVTTGGWAEAVKGVCCVVLGRARGAGAGAEGYGCSGRC